MFDVCYFNISYETLYPIIIHLVGVFFSFSLTHDGCIYLQIVYKFPYVVLMELSFQLI